MRPRLAIITLLLLIPGLVISAEELTAPIPGQKQIYEYYRNISPAYPSKRQYFTMIQKTIDQQLDASPIADASAKAVFTFRVAKSGEISNIILDESSGNDADDATARQAIVSASPLPPFPSDIPDDFFYVHFWFSKISPCRYCQQSSAKPAKEQPKPHKEIQHTRNDGKPLTAFEELVSRHPVKLSSPSQDLTIGMFVGGKEVIGAPAYFQDMQYYGQSRSTPGSVVLCTAYPPGFGLPGVYLAILKTDNLVPQHRYSCVVKIVDTFTAPTTFFLRLTEFYYARNGFPLTPGVFWMMPFKEKTYEIPIVEAIECLPGEPKATNDSIFYEEVVMP